MAQNLHSYYLEELICNLKKIDENRKDILWLCKEPMFFKRDGCNQKPCCDILLAYKDNSARALELKGSHVKREKAIRQLESGIILLNEWGYDVIRDSKIVYYSRNGYEYETISHSPQMLLNL